MKDGLISNGRRIVVKEDKEEVEIKSDVGNEEKTFPPK